ncbi:hypothetical protein BFP97_19895 [Roseivirga sp. 4D4]|uniref:hypothetical protein n=1 Tax=Roseivirga sp. 4D4 TaxID=1889784 RepID=UPI0008530A92|nr:hypothetical protein [Roseivirga sp. 4D4]OEK03641.1 hypothetical protein BFP97_19895 [Roseivirga sp. 4D4]
MEDSIYSKIIPPRKHSYRDGFSNLSAIDSLTGSQLKALEKRLLIDIVIGDNGKVDSLVVDTLVYVNSTEAVLSFEKLIKDNKIGIYSKLILITAIYRLSGDESHLNMAISIFHELRSESQVIGGMYYLSFFKSRSRRVRNILRKLVFNQNYFVRYNAWKFLKRSV